MTRPKRSLGQNFLIDPNIQQRIVAELDAGPHDLVLEVGPGHGELSRHLAGRVGRLVLVEKDEALAADLRAAWARHENVDIVEADILRVDLPGLLFERAGDALAREGGSLRVISNVPYNITSPLMFTLLGLRPAAVRLVLTVQREVAERIVARPGGKAYGALSVGVRAVADADLRFHIKPGAFRPRPDVDSSVLRIEPDPERVDRIDPEALRAVTRVCFGRRRKQLQKILRSAPEFAYAASEGVELLRRLDIDPAARPESLDPAAFVRLTEALAALS
ncbi:MAG: 16S rRNA (adenine(1518)-N(6)/adenine(1519)-N(6))-dimethyltransferase RsmA [Gemmatimonadetes bacterium]|nr:16S rRNA (adenine(1518)-N(6)/adenine(1519)-N(6))-dimethyltransferase RsmA [Gemmatimonadota bacterium]